MIKEKIPCGCRTIDELMCGGMPVRKVSDIEGISSVGKSLLGLQYCLNANKQGQDAIVVDTEGMEYDFAISFLAKRFGVKEPSTLVIGEGSRDIRDVLALFGLHVRDFKITEGGVLKTSIDVTDDFKIVKLIKEMKPKILLLDSFSQFIKNYIEMKSANLPRRATIEELLYGRLQVLAEKYDVAVVVVHHAEGIDPQFPNAYREAYSEEIVSYNTKYRLALMPTTSAQQKEHGRGSVRVRRVRYDLHVPTEWQVVRIKENWGFE